MTSDTTNLMGVSKAYGIDLSETGSVAGRFVQSGTLKSGEQLKFANLLATSIKDAGMTGRESEQLDVLGEINDNLSKTLVTVEENGQSNATALYSLLANSNDALKGSRGANAVTSINDSITGGGSKMDILLGWGSKYTGAEGRWELEERKAQGISNPDNLSDVFQNFERFTGQKIDSAQGKLALQELFGIDPELVNILVKNAEAIKTGTYSEDFKKDLEGYSGATDINGLLDNYNESKVSTQEQYANAKDNAQAATGNLWNSITSPFKNWFTGLSTGDQAVLSMGGKAAGYYAGAKGAKWAVNKFGDIFKKGSKSAADTADDVVDGVTNSADDVAKAATNSADDVSKGGSSFFDKIFKKGSKSAANSADDAVKGATNSVDDATKAVAGSMDDVAKAATNSADDVVKAAGKIGKFGKVVGVIGTALEAVSTVIDTKEALDKGDTKEAAGEVGEGVGSIAGGLGGAKAGAALGTLIAPGLGTAIGGALGGILGALGGDWLGETLAEEFHDAYTGKTKIPAASSSEARDKLYASHGDPAAQRRVREREKAKESNKSKPRHRKIGADYIPYDNYPSMLHRGEAVLTEKEAKLWREITSLNSISSSIDSPQNSGSGSNNIGLLEIRLSGGIDGMTSTNQNFIVQAIMQQLGYSNNSVLGNLGSSFRRTSS